MEVKSKKSEKQSGSKHAWFGAVIAFSAIGLLGPFPTNMIFVVLHVIVWSYELLSGAIQVTGHRSRKYTQLGSVLSFYALFSPIGIFGLIAVILGVKGYRDGDKEWGRNSILLGIFFEAIGLLLIFFGLSLTGLIYT